MTRFLTSTSIAALCCTTAFAQEIIDAGDIIVTANQAPVDSAASGVTVEVVTEEELTEAGTTQVIEQLRSVPGVTTLTQGPVGALGSIFIRGREAKYAPVYLDGIDMGDPSSVQTFFNWGGLQTAGLGRIEILKGSQSAVYGSEAVGGVINLSSAKLDAPGQELRFSAEYGSNDTFATSMTFLQKTERADLSFTLAHFETDGYSSADENEVGPSADDDGHKSKTLIFSGSVNATDALTLGGTFFIIDETANIDDFGGAFGDADRPTSSDRRGARIYATLDTGTIEHTFAVVRKSTDRRDPTSAFTTRFEGERTEVEYSGIAYLDRMTLSFGLANSREVAQLDNGTRNDFELRSAWVEGQFALSSEIDMTLSARAEDHTEFGSASTWRIASAWRVSDATTLRFSAGTGFRAPSLYELFGPFGNANLEAEDSFSVDLGIEHRYASGAAVKATVFYSEVDNLIGYDFATNAYNQVPGTSEAKGFELSGKFPIGDMVQLTGAYTYTDSRTASGAQLVRVPRHELSLGVQADITDRLSASLDLTHVADRANDGFPSRAMEDYTLVNAAFAYEISDTTEAYLRIENLTDKEYQTVAGYGTSDRAAFFGIRASF